MEQAKGKRALTKEQVVEMREASFWRDVPGKQLAAHYGMHPSSISLILTGQRYANVGGPTRPKRGQR